jgi:hypothetical protein
VTFNKTWGEFLSINFFVPDGSTSEAVGKVYQACSPDVSTIVFPGLENLIASDAMDDFFVQVSSLDAPAVVLSGLIDSPESEAVDKVHVQVGSSDVPTVVLPGLMDVPDSPESEAVDKVHVQVGSPDVSTVVLPGLMEVPSSEAVEVRFDQDISGLEEDGTERISQGNPSHWLEYPSLMGNTLPLKSRIVYLKAYQELEDYLKKQNQFVIGVAPSEHAMLNFFYYLKNVRHQAPSTIWYFMFCAKLLISCLFFLYSRDLISGHIAVEPFE